MARATLPHVSVQSVLSTGDGLSSPGRTPTASSTSSVGPSAVGGRSAATGRYIPTIQPVPDVDGNAQLHQRPSSRTVLEVPPPTEDHACVPVQTRTGCRERRSAANGVLMPPVACPKPLQPSETAFSRRTGLRSAEHRHHSVMFYAAADSACSHPIRRSSPLLHRRPGAMLAGGVRSASRRRNGGWCGGTHFNSIKAQRMNVLSAGTARSVCLGHARGPPHAPTVMVRSMSVADWLEPVGSGPSALAANSVHRCWWI